MAPPRPVWRDDRSCLLEGAWLGLSRVGLFEAMRRDRQGEELSVRALARRYGVHRRTVRQALASPLPPPRQRRSQPAPKLDPVKPLIDAMLREDLTAPRKQRHTARRVLARLVDEHNVHTITYSTVRDYVRVRRVEINAEAGRSVQEAFVPQTHEPAAEAEVDFADLWIELKGIRTKVFLFTLRLSYSGRAAHRVFASQGQEAFLEGHVYAFEQLGGTPIDKIRYDNLKSAVSRVLLGRNRIESERWILFRSWYGFQTFYCEKGLAGAHEKCGVEGEGGRFRRTHLVPVPTVASLTELNERLAGYDDADDARRISNRANTVGENFATEQPLLRATLANPKLDERQVLMAVLEHDPHLLLERPGLLILADKGYVSAELDAYLAQRGVRLLRPSYRNRTPHPAQHLLKPVRQLIESVNDTLKGQLDLELHGGRTIEGVAARIAQRVLALTAAIWHNRATGQPVTRSLIAFDH